MDLIRVGLLPEHNFECLLQSHAAQLAERLNLTPLVNIGVSVFSFKNNGERLDGINLREF